MEQYSYQQEVIVEPAKAKKPIGLQVTALVLGIIGMVIGFIAYFYTVFSNVGMAVAADKYGYSQTVSTFSGVGIIVDIVIAIFCLVALILAIAGLVKSIRRVTRTVPGIVMSAIGLNLSAAGFALTVIGLFISGFFRLLMTNGAFH